MQAPIALLSLLAVSFGLKHVAPRAGDQAERIAWAPDYASGAELAKAQHEPLLVIMVAGERDGEC